MVTKKIWANLAVNDLERTSKFYTAIGFKQNADSKDLTSFTVGDKDFIIHFFKKDILEKAVKGPLADLHKGNEVLFTLSAESKEEVDTWEREIRAAGGNIISDPAVFGQGYYGFDFSDPDGHRFNVFLWKD
jgi:uncharacterized protein